LERVVIKARIAIDNLVVPKVGTVAKGTQEVVLIEHRALDVLHGSATVRIDIDAVARRRAAERIGRLIQEYARLPARIGWWVSAATVIATTPTTATTSGKRGEEDGYWQEFDECSDHGFIR
jgi:hypothetical protein